MQHVISRLLLDGARVLGESGDPHPSFSSHLSQALQTLGLHTQLLLASAHNWFVAESSVFGPKQLRLPFSPRCLSRKTTPPPPSPC